jgi:GxxExxY protein
MIDEEIGKLNHQVIGACIEVHRHLGPGLFESVYSECLCCELDRMNIPFQREMLISIDYKGSKITNAFRLDLLIDQKLVLELKSIEKIERIHKVQVSTYLRLGGFPVGLLINFNTVRLVDGITRILPPTQSDGVPN